MWRRSTSRHGRFTSGKQCRYMLNGTVSSPQSRYRLFLYSYVYRDHYSPKSRKIEVKFYVLATLFSRNELPVPIGQRNQWTPAAVKEKSKYLTGNITLILPSRSLLRQSEGMVLPFHLHLGLPRLLH
jgi:hypothetical protein